MKPKKPLRQNSPPIDDLLTDRIVALKGGVPQGRPGLPENEKDGLILRVGGPKTATSIVKAQKDLPASRIAFLFSSVDTQAVVDILVNDMTAALQRAERKANSK